MNDVFDDIMLKKDLPFSNDSKNITDHESVDKQHTVGKLAKITSNPGISRKWTPGVIPRNGSHILPANFSTAATGMNLNATDRMFSSSMCVSS